ncbi:MAG TPA: alpha/beta fold hydrolase [Solirubrobacteraceae bacterium]|nr:alpha/beta fold hydrolase [Solirubrobacteraceae bacterium]
MSRSNVRAEAGVVRSIHVNGLRLKTIVRGQGRPLLLIGGIGANTEMCEPFARALTRTELVMFDLPGCGGSSTPRRPMSMAGLASVVEGILDELGYRQLDVLGVSMGGGLAQQLARQAPERVRRLVLVATGCGLGMVPGRPLAMGVMMSPLRYYSTPFFKLAAPFFLGGEKWKDREFVREHGAARRAKPPSVLGYYIQAMSAMTFSSLPWLHTLRHHTLVLSGDDDPIVPAANGALLARRIPNSRFHLIRGGGHLFILDSPHEVAPLVEDFLGEAMPAEQSGERTAA